MTQIYLPDDLAREAVELMGRSNPDEAVAEALSEYFRYQRQLKVLELEGQFDFDSELDPNAPESKV